MKTISIILVVRSHCEGLAIGQELHVLGRVEDNLGQWLRTALLQHNIPVSRDQWLICHEGRALSLDLRLPEIIPDLPGRGTIVLELFVMPSAVGKMPTRPPTEVGEKDIFETSQGAGTMPRPPGARPETDSSSEFDLTLDKSVVEEDASGSQIVSLDTDEEEVVEEDEGLDLDLDCSEQEMEDEEEAESVATMPRARARMQGAAETKRVQRHATVRYYSRMNPTRLYPLLVAITKEAVVVVEKQKFDQKAASFKAARGSVVEVEPILPGCDCYPPKQQVRITGEEVQVVFHVALKVLGKITSARVVLTQKGKTLADIPLSMQVSNKTMVAVFALLSLVLPFTSALLKHFRIDFESQLQDGFGVYLTIANVILNSLSPGVLGGLLLGATIVSYLYLRPEKRDLFWELTPGSQGQALANRTFGNMIRRVLRTTPRFALYGASICLALGLGIGCLAAVLGSAHQALAQAPRALSILLAFGAAAGAVAGVILGVVSDDRQ